MIIPGHLVRDTSEHSRNLTRESRFILNPKLKRDPTDLRGSTYVHQKVKRILHTSRIKSKRYREGKRSTLWCWSGSFRHSKGNSKKWFKWCKSSVSNRKIEERGNVVYTMKYTGLGGCDPSMWKGTGTRDFLLLSSGSVLEFKDRQKFLYYEGLNKRCTN